MAEDPRRLAIRFALVLLVTDLRELDADDRMLACAENGWRSSDASPLYTRTIDTVLALAEGRLDPAAYLEDADV